VQSLILALSLLAPTPPPDPAPPTFPIAIDTQATLPDGRIIHLQGTITGTLLEAPKPLPGPQITALKNQAGQGVEQVRSGEVLVIEGVQLWHEKAQLRVQIPGHIGTVVSRSPTRIDVRFAAVSAAVTGPLLIYHNTGGTGWVEVTRGPRITLLPATAPPARPTAIRGYRGLSGELREVFVVGEPLVIHGEGFGEQTGEVWINYTAQAVRDWSDREIRLTTPAFPNATWPAVVQIRRPEWEGTRWLSDFLTGPMIVLPGE
jgi:hypothetical protein